MIKRKIEMMKQKTKRMQDDHSRMGGITSLGCIPRWCNLLEKGLPLLLCSFMIGVAVGAKEIGIAVDDNSVKLWTTQASSPTEYYTLETSTNLVDWSAQGSTRLGNGGALCWDAQAPNPRDFFRFVKSFEASSSFNLQGSLDDQINLGSSASLATGSALFTTGRTDEHKAYVLDGTNPLDLTGPGSVGAMTLCQYVYLDDLVGSAPVLFDSGSATGNVRLFFRDNHAGTYTGDGKDRDVGLVFQVVGNAGGNGTAGDRVETTYRRFAEHSADFIDAAGHERKKKQLWLHLAVSYDPAANRVDFYINGKHDSTRFFTTSQPPVLGTCRVGADLSGNNAIIGKISDVGLYDSVLPAENIRALGDFRHDLWALKDFNQWAIDRTYYVDVVNGDDNNDASTSAPLKTLAEAVGRINDLTSWKAQGSRIILRPGTYREGEIYLKENGTRFKPIVIEAETPGTVVISGSEVWDDDAWTETSAGSGIWTHSWTYNFGRDPDAGGSIDHSTERRFRRELLFLDGDMCRPYTQLSDLQAGADPHASTSFITDEHAFYVDESSDLIYLRTTSNPNSSFVEVGVHERLLRFNEYYNNCDYTVVRGIRFQHAASFAGRSPLDIVGSTHVLIEDCDLVDNGSSGLGSTGEGKNTLIRRCRFLRNGRDGFALSRGYSNALVQDCVVERNQWRNDLGKYTGPDLAAVGKIMFSSRIHLERVRVADHNRIGFWVDAQNWDVTLEDCYFRGNDGAIWFEISTLNQEALRSGFYANRKQGIMMAGENIRLEDNLFQQSDIAGAWGILSTLYYDLRDEQAYIPDIYMGTDAQLLGNTISVTDASAKLIRFQNSTFIANSMRSENNIFHTLSSSDRIYVPAAMDFSTWQATFNDTGSQLLLPEATPFENDGGVVAEFGLSFARISETGCAQVPVTLSKGVDTSVTVDVTVESLTATEGDDFRVIGAGTVTFSPLQRTHMINVPILRDDVPEGEETLRLHLSNPVGVNLGSTIAATIVIPASSDTALLPFVPSYNARETIEGEAFDSRYEINELVGVGFGRFRKNHWAMFSNVDFGNVSPSNLVVNMAVPVGRGGRQIEFRLDSPTGPLIATVTTIDTDSTTTSDERTWDVFLPMPDAAVSGATGVHDLYIINNWDYTNCGVIDSFIFN